MAIITLNNTQLTLIERDLNGLEVLNPSQIFTIASQIEKKITLPQIDVEDNYRVICKIIKKIDRNLYKILPNEYYLLINNKNKGITEKETHLIQERLSEILQKKIQIPFLSKNDEQIFIEFVVISITKAMQVGNKL